MFGSSSCKKKAQLSKVVSSDKEKTNERPLPKPNHQPSKTTMEVADNADNYWQCVFVRNAKNIIEPDDDNDDDADVMAQAAEMKMKQCEPGPSVQKKKNSQ